MDQQNIARRILFATPLVAAAHMAFYYPRLPERMASHFGPGGQADGWMSKTSFAIFYMVLIVIMTAVMGKTGTLLNTLPPELINLPHKEYWLAPERRAETAARFGETMASFGIVVNLFFITTMQLVFQANLNGTERLNMPVFAYLLAGFFVFLAIWLMRIFRMYRLPS